MRNVTGLLFSWHNAEISDRVWHGHTDIYTSLFLFKPNHKTSRLATAQRPSLTPHPSPPLVSSLAWVIPSRTSSSGLAGEPLCETFANISNESHKACWQRYVDDTLYTDGTICLLFSPLPVPRLSPPIHHLLTGSSLKSLPYWYSGQIFCLYWPDQ